MPDLSPDLATVIEAALDTHQAGIYTSMVARVESYDASVQTVSVQPLAHNTYIGEDDSLVHERHPVLTDVPLMFPGSGGYRVTFPVKAGDTVLIVCSTTSLAEWKSTNTESAPADTRRNHPSGSIAIPGLRSPAAALGSAPTDFMTVGQDGGLVIEIDNNEIRVGGSGAGFVVLASPYRTREDAMVNALLGLVNALSAVHAPSGTYPDPGTVTACGAAVTAINAFIANASSYISQFGKVW